MPLGPLMVGVQAHALTADERERLRHPLVGGVVLFTRNYQAPTQVTALVAEIHALRTPPLLVAVDHEGGRVQRFREGFTALPTAHRIGHAFDENPARGRALAQASGWLMAAELRAVGVDISFAPVLDLDWGVSRVIGDRAFHRDAESAAVLARAYMAGMHRAGMAAVGKHFPGHGAVAPDSHISVAVDARPLAALEEADLIPFARLISAGLEGIMPAHVIYSNVAPEPAGFARIWLQDILRERLGFAGVIFSDDLEMEGASVAGDIVARAQAALTAGCDMILSCNDPLAAAALLAELPVVANPLRQARLLRLHGQGHADWATLCASPPWSEAVALLASLNDSPPLQLV